MLNAAAYAMQSDPLLNRQFRRGWVDPPDQRKRERRPVARGTALEIKSNLNKPEDNDASLPVQARRAA